MFQGYIVSRSCHFSTKCAGHVIFLRKMCHGHEVNVLVFIWAIPLGEKII